MLSVQEDSYSPVVVWTWWSEKNVLHFAESLTPVVHSVDRLCAIWNSTITRNFKGKYRDIMFRFLYYVGHLESKERLRIQPAQLFNFS